MTVLFWPLMLLMVAVAAAVVIIPLNRQPPTDTLARRDANLHIVRERLAELEAERRSGKLDEESYQQLRIEVERTALVDLPEDAPQLAVASPWRWPALLLVLILPLGGLVYYYQGGYQGEVANWIDLLERHGNRLEQAIYRPEALREVADGDLPGLIRVLQARVLTQGKNDPDSLYALGMAYLEMEDPQPALIMLERVLTLDPGYQDARLAYIQGMLQLGTLAFRAGEYQAAINAWQPLLAIWPPNSPTYQQLQKDIGSARARLAGDTAPAPSLLGTAVATAADADTPPGDTPKISVTVDLDPELASRISPEDTLFVFARPAQGPTMPLLVERLPVGDFPMEVILDQNDAMMPSLRLADAGSLVIGARVSRAGEAIPQAGDLEGLSGAVSLAEGSPAVKLLIDQVVP